MKKNYFLILLVSLLSSIGLIGQNLVVNGDLEAWDDDANPSGWSKMENISKDATVFHGGSFSAAHMSESSTKDFNQDVQGIVGGQQYHIQYYYLDNSASARTRIWSYWLDADGNTLADNEDVLRPSTYSEDNAEWMHFDVSLLAPANATQFRFEVRVYKQDGNVGGMVNYDDFSVEGDMNIYPEPSNHVTSFLASASTVNMKLDWTDAIGDVLPTAYLIKGNILVVKSPQFSPPVDGVPEPDDNDWSDFEGAANVAYGTETYTFTDLVPGNLYEFGIYPYTNSGENIDYKTDGNVPSVMATIPYISVINQEGFDDGLGTWTPYNVEGAQEWYQDEYSGQTYAKMSGFDGQANVNEDWLISPKFDLAQYDSVFFSFESAYNYDGPHIELRISHDYDGVGNPNDFTWVDISSSAVWSDGSWNWLASGDVSFNDYLQDDTYAAFVFASTASESSTWELDSFLVFGYMGVGLDENADNSIQMFPNPASSFVQIQSEENGQLHIYGINGQLVLLQDIQKGNNTIDLSVLNKGLYIVKDNQTDGEIKISKLIIK